MSFQILIRRWSTARLVQPMVLIFSLVLLSVSLAYFGVFNWQRRLVKAWFLIYTVVPLCSAIATFAYRDRPSANPVHLPLRQQHLLRTKAIGLSLYGLALLIIPALSTAFWPWAIDAFHARLYSAIFLATGFGNWLLSRSATALELMILGSIELLLGALTCLGIVNIDRTLERMDWAQPGSLLWLLLLGIWAIAGALLIRQSFRWQSIT